MTLRPRPAAVPRAITVCWVTSTVAGGLLVGLGPEAAPDPRGLTPSTLPGYLQRAAGPEARGIRVNGVYGSGRDGAWQFVAHLTWRDSGGQVAGGVVKLPEGAGAPTDVSPVTSTRLAQEELMGWTLRQFNEVVEALPVVQDSTALVELEIPPGGGGSLTYCVARRSAARGRCTTFDASGRAGSDTTVELTVDPLAGPLSVQRR